MKQLINQKKSDKDIMMNQLKENEELKKRIADLEKKFGVVQKSTAPQVPVAVSKKVMKYTEIDLSLQ